MYNVTNTRFFKSAGLSGPSQATRIPYAGGRPAPPDDDTYVAFSYTELAAAFEPLAGTIDQSADEAAIIVRHYIELLRKRIVGDEEMQTLAARLYERQGSVPVRFSAYAVIG